MNKTICTVMMTALLVLLMAGSAMCATYDSNVTLVEKNAEWQPVEGGASALVEYNSAGDEFEYSIVGEGLEPCMCYKLIYYADRPDRFNATQWGGNNPGALIGSVCADEDGNITQSDSVELDMNLPHPDDFNIAPGDEYCGEPDDYANTCGAKIWLVTHSDYNESESKVLNWGNHANWLFEDNLIWYDDVDENYELEITETYNDANGYNAGDEPGVVVSAIVRDYDGKGDLMNTTAMANFSQHGIEEHVEMEFVEMINCTSALFESDSVVIKQSTCTVVEDWRQHPYYYWHQYCVGFKLECEEVNVEITIADDNATTNFSVGADDPHYLEVTGPESKFRFPEIPVWTHNMEQKMCRWDDHDWWRTSGWPDCRDFMSHAAYLDVWIYDQYGNPVDNDVCYRNLYVTNNGTPVSVQSSHCRWDNDEDENNCRDCRNKIWAIDLLAETVEFTVYYSEDEYHEGDGASSVAPDSCVVNFISYVDDMIVTVEDTPVFTDCTMTANVSAQLMDESGSALEIEGVPIMFSTSNQNIAVANPQWASTDENGIACTDLCTGDTAGIVSVYAASECRPATEPGELEVLEGPDDIAVRCDADYLVINDSCEEPDNTEVTVQLLNDSDMPFMVAGMNVTAMIVYDGECEEGAGSYAYYETNDDGTAVFDLEGTPEPCDITICVEMASCGLRSSENIDVVEPVMDALLMDVDGVMNPGDVQIVNVTGLNTTRGMVMCSPDGVYNFSTDNVSIVEWEYDSSDNATNAMAAMSLGNTTVNVTCGGVSSGDIVIEVVLPDPCEGVVCDNTTCVGVDLYNMTCENGVCVKYMLIESNCVDCGYSSGGGSSGSSGSSSSGGLYYYDSSGTDSSDNETDQDDPVSDDPKPADVKPLVNLPGGDSGDGLDTTPDDKDKSSGGYDPTNAILLVLALLAVCVIGYVIYQKSQR